MSVEFDYRGLHADAVNRVQLTQNIIANIKALRSTEGLDSTKHDLAVTIGMFTSRLLKYEDSERTLRERVNEQK